MAGGKRKTRKPKHRTVKHRSSKGCVIDEDTVDAMVKLYRKGWFVRIYKPYMPGCFAELRDEPKQN